MNGDFTRLTFRPERHFSGVRLQQGRVLLDADWNEQVDIVAHRDRTAAADAFGPVGPPCTRPASPSSPSPAPSAPGVARRE